MANIQQTWGGQEVLNNVKQSCIFDTFDLSIHYTVILALVPLVVDFRQPQFNTDVSI